MRRRTTFRSIGRRTMLPLPASSPSTLATTNETAKPPLGARRAQPSAGTDVAKQPQMKPSSLNLTGFLAVSLLTTAVAGAQSGSGTTKTAFGNVVQLGTKVDRHSLKTGTRLTSLGPIVTSSVRGRGIASPRVSATSKATAGAVDLVVGRVRKTGYRGFVSDVGVLYNRISRSLTVDAATTGNGGKAGSHTCRFVFSATKPTPGTLELEGLALGRGGTAAASVAAAGKVLSVQAGGSSKKLLVRVTLDSRGLVALVSTSGLARLRGRGRASYQSIASVTFVPDDPVKNRCKVAVGAQGCGPLLTGVASSGQLGESIRFELDRAAKTALGLQMFSPDGKTVPVQGCPLFRSVVFVAAFQTDGRGKSSAVLRIPKGLGFTFSVGDVILIPASVGVRFASSNTLDVRCRK